MRSSNVLSIMAQNYASMGLLTIIWAAWGYSLCFGESQGDFVGNPKSHYFLENTNNNSPASTIPGLVFCGFQGMFAVIAPALMTGAFADRVNFGPYMVFIALWAHLVYFPVCHWIWGGGWMAKQGVWDFAGGIVIHVTAGFSALATVVALPSRHHLDASVENKPHNVPLVAFLVLACSGLVGLALTVVLRLLQTVKPRMPRSTRKFLHQPRFLGG